MKKKILFLCFCSLLITACQREYKGEYIKWVEKTNSNATELLKENGIPYKIKDGIIYIPEDAFDKSIMCCA
ncbi:hypothetical protein MZM54_23700 [[Brevibacterium] frigoritolerans]|nr:hypothetical protein [Peribacillus frigoritolerans]